MYTIICIISCNVYVVQPNNTGTFSISPLVDYIKISPNSTPRNDNINKY